MSLFASCSAFAPALLCRHADLLVYLVPSLALALLIHVLCASHPFFLILTLPGTACHELAHFVAGLVSGAAPSKLTIIPRRSGRSWELGSVMLNRVRWYNAAPAALAPFAIVLIPFVVAWWRTRHGLHFGPLDLGLTFLLAPQFLSFWPSDLDWRLSLRSWPWLPIGAAAAWIWFHPSLFQYVTG